ncbi:MAG: flippase [Desulfobacterales bacterium]|nr:flippase [Desulfobacterales bacterium]
MRLFSLIDLKNRFVKNVVSNYLGFAVNAVVTLLLTPFLIRSLGTATFGAWILLNTILAYFRLLELGIMPAVIRYVSLYKARGEKKEIESIIGSAVLFLFLVSIITIPVIYLAAEFGPRFFNLADADQALFVKAIWLIGLAAVLSYFARLFFAVFEGYQRFDLLNICSASGTLLMAGLTVVFVIKGYGLLALILILTGQIAYELLFKVVVIRVLFQVRITPFAADRRNISRLRGFSFYAFLTDVALNISHKIDTLVIGIFMPVSAITFYEISTKLSGFLEKLTDPLVDTFFPLASELHTADQAESLRKLLLEGTKISLLLVTPGLIIFSWYGADIIRWWVGEDYVGQSLPILYVFLGVIALSVLDSTASRILLGTGRIKFAAAISLVAAVSNLTLSLILVKKYGLIGVALGTLIPAAVCNLFISLPYTCSITGTPILAFYLKIFLPVGLTAGGSLLLIAATSDLFPNRALSCAVHTFLVAGLTLLVINRFILPERKSRDSCP